MKKIYTEAMESLKEGWVKDDTLEKAFKAYRKDCEEHYDEYRENERKRAAGVARLMNQVVGAEVY